MPQKAKLLIAAMILTCTLLSAGGLWWTSRQVRRQAPLMAELQFAQDNWTSTETISDAVELRLLGRAFTSCTAIQSTPPNQELAMYRLTLDFADRQGVYLITHDLRIFNPSLNEEFLLNRDGLQLLDTYLSKLKRQQFGELLPWDEASQLIPRYSTFMIRDLETGLAWRSQRRGGSRHADIQPLTKADTATLKTIYDGAWSWNRRAVVVEHAGRRIAASINGMPHGAGALVNGFPGHHCLHFLGSTTHGGSNHDPMHQLMVHHAAGELHEYLDRMPPEQLQLVALELAGQGNTEITHLIIQNSGHDWAALAGQIRDIRIWSDEVGPAAQGKLTGDYTVSVFFVGDPREHRMTVSLTCRYFGSYGKWLLEPDYLEQLTAPSRD
jgi:hypothetical protein